MSKKSPFYGNRATKKYHTSKKNKDSCRVGEIKAVNRVPFHSAEEAVDAGYVACKLCVNPA